MVILALQDLVEPWMRDRCSFGTISEVEACMAGQ
jgi:hypothetical protein